MVARAVVHIESRHRYLLTQSRYVDFQEATNSACDHATLRRMQGPQATAGSRLPDRIDRVEVSRSAVRSTMYQIIGRALKTYRPPALCTTPGWRARSRQYADNRNESSIRVTLPFARRAPSTYQVPRAFAARVTACPAT